MLDKTHSYATPGSYKIKISNVKDFRPVVDTAELNLDTSNISNSNEEAQKNMFFETVNHIAAFHPDIDIEDFTDVFNERYEEDYLPRALETYVFNKYANMPITDIKVSYNTTTIGNCACENMISLNTFNFDNIEHIGELAFANCFTLGFNYDWSSYSQYSLKLSNKLKTIGKMAFLNCSSLRSILIPKSVTSIGYHAFGSCKNLHLIVFEGRSMQDVQTDFPGLLVEEDGKIKNTITSTNGYLVFENDAPAEEFAQLIAELDEAYPITTAEDLNLAESSPYDDDEPCPLEASLNSAQGNILFTGATRKWVCTTGSCNVGQYYGSGNDRYMNGNYSPNVTICYHYLPGVHRINGMVIGIEHTECFKPVSPRRFDDPKPLEPIVQPTVLQVPSTPRLASAAMPPEIYGNKNERYKDIVQPGINIKYVKGVPVPMTVVNN